MKISILVLILILICLLFTNQLLSQDEKFHEVIFDSRALGVTKPTIPYPEIYYHSKENFEQYNSILEIQADFKMAYIWIYNSTGFEYFDQIDTNNVNISMPDGIYYLFTGYVPYENQHSFIIKEDVEVIGNTQIKLAIEDAVFSNIYTFNKITSDTLNISTINFYFINQLILPNFRIFHTNINSNIFTIRHNSLPDHFNAEWAVKGKPNYNDDNLYLLNNQLFFYQTDTVITNDILDFTFADIDYYLPDSIPHNIDKQIGTLMPDHHRWGSGDKIYTYPLIQRIYQDTSAAISLMTSKFWQSLSMFPFPNFMYTTEMRFKNNKIVGFHYQDSEAPSFVLSDTNYVKLGQPPYFWFGKFFNSTDTIKIQSSYGKWIYLFLSQTNDLMRHFPIDYRIFQNTTLIDSGIFDLLFGAPGLKIGFDPDDTTIPVQPGKYCINIKNSYNFVADVEGYSEVNASFDLNNADKNPPNLVSFQLLFGKEITHKFTSNSNKKIRFIAEDDVVVDSLSLSYSYLDDSVKYEIPLIFNNPYWEGILPELSPGYFNLHTYIEDNSQNYIQCNMCPAFVIDSSVLIINKQKTIAHEFSLHQNYPNPFNSTTLIPFEIPIQFKCIINISVYDILGQKIKTLFDGYMKNKYNFVSWDGRNDNNFSVSSGIYFICLKGGDIQRRIKIVLIN